MYSIDFDRPEQSILEQVANLLERDGWTVTTRSDESTIAVSFLHPLTSSYGARYGRASGVAFHDFLTGVLQQREFALVQQLNGRSAHPRLLGRLREVAKANDWDREVMQTIGDLLAEQGVITHEEADWLEEAGLPWNAAATTDA